ncbi:MAG: 4Fe-4S dicluster domain-containing protein [Vampirovibrionales bacterium]|nr:4Fe-4S dicluster domain-containing protein [Vampirovibrionales bacterium]
MNTVAAQKRAQQALADRQFFKLIAGGSLTHPDVVAALVSIYGTLFGVACIDIAPDWPVVSRVVDALQALEKPPLLMLSLDVDGDPHFRKAMLTPSSCTACGDCVPVCPTQAFTLSQEGLVLSEPLCYGCGRCLPICPSDALHAKSTSQLPELLVKSLSHPQVGAIELHVNQLACDTLEPFLERLKPYLLNKLISLCFRPAGASAILSEVEALRLFVDWCQGQNAFAMLQIDGAPMSGSGDPAASLPALANARFYQAYHAVHLSSWRASQSVSSALPVTISGGINATTGRYLKAAQHQFIAGVGVGTVARQAVWPWLDELEMAKSKASQLVAHILSVDLNTFKPS